MNEDLKLTRLEQETTINYNQEETEASIYTCNGSFKRKLVEWAKEYPEIKYESDNGFGVTYTIPKRLISLRHPKKRTMSQERRQAAGERLKEMQNKKRLAKTN